VILVDSSVWVDFFRPSFSGPSRGRGGAELRRMIEESEPFALTGIVVSEILQGLTRDAGVIERFLTQWDMLEPRGFETYRGAAAIYRAGRGKGVTFSTIDTLIAAIALEHGASVFTLDRDFMRIARMTGLELY
jgi:predicted nucleic acid-binding protein